MEKCCGNASRLSRPPREATAIEGGGDAAGGHSFRRPFPELAPQRLFRERDGKGEKEGKPLLPTDLTAGTLSRFLQGRAPSRTELASRRATNTLREQKLPKPAGRGGSERRAFSLGGAIPAPPSNQPPAPGSTSSGMASRSQSCGAPIALLPTFRLGSA